MSKKPSLRNICLFLEYEGTNYYGWQLQPARPTIQGELLKAIKKLTGENVTLFGSGRTDRGVHATMQVANFKTRSSIPTSRIPHGLNAYLPSDITVVRAKEVPLDFNSQFNAKSKRYRYTILNRKTPRALLRNTSYLIRRELSIKDMKKAARYFIGKKDFRAFAKESKKRISTIRRISEILIKKQKDILTIEIEGDGFLYTMVRAIVGTLLEVGLGKMSLEKVKEIISSRDRKLAGPNVPAKGLCLIKVTYEKDKDCSYYN
jgi:tRNA pseudouridine38-40 synthase